MRRSGPIARRALLVAAILALARDAGAQAQKDLAAEPLRAGEALAIDGRLDEPAWVRAPEGRDFVERVPYPGTPAAADTRFRVLYDAHQLYLGVVMRRGPGEGPPRALELLRDSFAIFDDEALSLKFDVRDDKRTTVGFVTNPAGTQLDYVAVENGSFRREFDAVWDVATTVTATAWIAEFRIPTLALGIPAGTGERHLGLNLSHDHNARLATYDWSPMPPEFGATSALHYGRLSGLRDLAGGRPMTLIPFALASYVPKDASPWTASLGGDARLRLGEDVWSELSILTDFAQVELDAPVINLNRFPLFFQERRPFFLAGVEVFEHGAAGFAQLFFTRRIGLDDDGREVPMLGGAKVYGSAGALRFGALEVLTGDSDTRDAASWSVARARYNWGEDAHLGVIGTLSTEAPGLSSRGEVRATPQLGLGLDGSLRGLERRLDLRGFWSGVADTAPGRAPTLGHAGQAWLRWRGEHVNPEALLTFISDDFDPEAGFVARKGLVQSRVNLSAVARPKDLGLREAYLLFSGQLEHAYSEDLQLGQRFDASFGLTTDDGWFVTGGMSSAEDYVQSPFEVVEGREVAVGRYRGRQASFGVSSPSGRNPRAKLGYRYDGALFGGALHGVSAGGEVAFGPHFKLRATNILQAIDFPNRPREWTFTVDGAVVVAPSTTLALDVFYQLNAFEERANVLARLRWRYFAGSDLFLVYRERLTWEEGETGERSVTLKLAHRFDALW
jgi:hypothetical protein